MNHLLTEFDLRLTFRRIWENLRPGAHFIFDLITPCQPLGGAQTYIRRLGSGRRRAAQHIRWNPWQRILSIFVVMDSPSSKVSTLEAHRERAYSPAEVGGVVDGRRLSNPSCARRHNTPYGYRLTATRYRSRSKKAV